MVIFGTTLFRLDGNSYYSPAFARGGEAAMFTVETTHVSGSTTFVVDVQHRNQDETVWATLGTFANITAVGTSTKDLTGIKELARFKFTFSSADPACAVHIIVPTPSWRAY